MLNLPSPLGTNHGFSICSQVAGIPEELRFCPAQKLGMRTSEDALTPPGCLCCLPHTNKTSHMGFISPRACPHKSPKPPCLSLSAPSHQSSNLVHTQSRHIQTGDTPGCAIRLEEKTDPISKSDSLPFWNKSSLIAGPYWFITMKQPGLPACSITFLNRESRTFFAGNLQGPTANI